LDLEERVIENRRKLHTDEINFLSPLETVCTSAITTNDFTFCTYGFHMIIITNSHFSLIVLNM
jgi:hypothetical protein